MCARPVHLLTAANVNSLLRTTECGAEGGRGARLRGSVRGYSGERSGMEFRTKMLEALRYDAETAADAIDEAQQQLNVLYKSIRGAHADGHTVPELEQATGLHPVA